MNDQSNIATDSEAVKDTYAARRPGWPGYVAICATDPRWAKDTAKTLSDWVKAGYQIVGLVTRSESVRGIKEYMVEKDRRAAQPAKANLPNDGLFA